MHSIGSVGRTALKKVASKVSYAPGSSLMSSGGSPRSARISGGIFGADFVTSDFEFITSDSCMSLPPLIDAHGLLPHAAPACNALTDRRRRQRPRHPPLLIFFEATQGALDAGVE